MKARKSFVSNSSTSSFIVNASSVNDAKERLVESIASFLDEKATHESHVKIAREFVERECRAENIEFAKLDDTLTFRDLRHLLWTDWPENIVKDEDKGKVVMADHERNSIAAEYAESDTWMQDEECILRLMKENGFERR